MFTGAGGENLKSYRSFIGLLLKRYPGNLVQYCSSTRHSGIRAFVRTKILVSTVFTLVHFGLV